MRNYAQTPYCAIRTAIAPARFSPGPDYINCKHGPHKEPVVKGISDNYNYITVRIKYLRPENGITQNNVAFVFIRELHLKIVNSQSQ